MENQIQTKEKEKKQWQSFANKAFGKRGFVKKSIFKTPESSDGKVIIYNIIYFRLKFGLVNSINTYLRLKNKILIWEMVFALNSN